MAIKINFKGNEFGVGDTIKVVQKIAEEGKSRLQIFEGIVVSLKGKDKGKSFTVRKMGTQQIGIERIFPIASPSIEKIEVVRSGVRGVKRSKLYYIRGKSRKEIEKIYSLAIRRKKE